MKPFAVLRLSTRSLHCLEQRGIRNIGQLCQTSAAELVDRQSWMSADELRERRWLAELTIRELRTRLAEFGLGLRGDRYLDLVNEPPEKLGLTLRAASLVRFLRVNTVGELLALSSRDLFEYTFRPVAVRDLYRTLAANGLSLRDGYPRSSEDWTEKQA